MNFFRRAKTAPEPVEQSPVSPKPEMSLKARLAGILQAKNPVAAGCFHLVGLTEVRERLGPKWDRVKDKVHQWTRRAIEKHIGPRDVYFPNGPEDYVLVFAALDKTAAQLVCGKIATEVQQALFGDSDLSTISIRTVVGELDGNLHMETTTLSEVLATAQAAAPITGVGATQIGAGPSTTTGATSASASAAVANANAAPIPSFGPSASAAQAVPAPAPFLSTIQSGDSEDEIAASIRYRPVWDVKREVVSTYYTRSVKRDNLAAYNWGAAPNASSIAKLARIDSVILKSGMEMLADLYRNKFRLRMSFPVGFETLAGLDRRRAYIELCRAIPEHLFPLIVFELVDLPAGVPNGRLAELASLLRPFCGLVSATVDFKADIAQYPLAGIRMVNAVIERGADEPGMFTAIDRLAVAAGRAGLQCSVEGVVKSSLALACKGSGVGYISGDRVGKPVDVPEHMLRLTWMELYFGRQKAQ